MLKVMTPLLGMKTPSALVGAKSDGERRAARSPLSRALWSGMGRLWRGMGGMGRPEPLSAHHPRQQQGLSGFHGSRDSRHSYCLARGVSQREFRGFHETRDTRHESRLLCFPTHHFPPFPTISHDFPAFPGPPTPPPPIKCPRAVRLSWSAARTAAPRRPVTAFLRAVGRLWSGMSGILPLSQFPRAVGRRSRRPPGSFQCGERQMKPC